MNPVVVLIKQRIKDRKMSIRNLARNSGMDHSFLAKVIAGKRTLPREEKTLRRLAKALGLDPICFVFSAGLVPQEYQKIFSDPNFIRSLSVQTSAAGGQTGPDAKKTITEELL